HRRPATAQARYHPSSGDPGLEPDDRPAYRHQSGGRPLREVRRVPGQQAYRSYDRSGVVMSYLRPVLTENIPERRSRAEATAPRPFLSTLTLLAADVVGLGVGGAVGLWVAELAGSTYLFAGWHVLIVMCIVFGAFALADLYPGAGVSPVDELRSIILILSALAVVDWAIRVGSGANGGQLVLPLAASYLAAMAVVVQLRLMLRELLSHRAWWGVPAIVLGAGQTAALIID